MADDHLQRLAADLSTMRQAIRVDKPYAADDMPVMFLLAIGGLLAAALVRFTSIDARLCLLLALVPAIAMYCRQSLRRRRNRAHCPELWREIKLSLIVLLIVLPLVVGWFAWSRIVGTPLLHTRASAVFFVGVGLGVIGLIDPNRRAYLAGSMGLIPYGMAIPWLSERGVALGGAIALVMVGFIGAAIIGGQLRRDSAGEP